MKKNVELELTQEEKHLIKARKISQKVLSNYAIDEIITILSADAERGKTLKALFEFQCIDSIGVKFAKDLILLGYYDIASLKDKSGPELLNAYEKHIGKWTDPCVEDQFWLVVNHANHLDSKKKWWDFTSKRKAYRSQFGYPSDRPTNSGMIRTKVAAIFSSKELQEPI